MQKHLDGNTLISDLMMMRTADDRVFLVLEGDSDVRAIQNMIDRQDCVLISGYGRLAVLKAMAILAGSDPDGAVALVDRDFGHWLREQLPPNVITTGLYDREMDTLLLGGLLDDYLNASGDDRRIKALVGAAGEVNLVAVMVRMAATVGRLSWASIRDRIDLNLSEFPLGSIGIVDWPWDVNVDALIQRALHRTKECASSPESIRASYDIDPPTEDRRELCRGHDLVAIAAASSEWWGPKSVGKREITTFVTGALRCDVLQRLPWYEDLDDWARSRGRRIWNCTA